MGSQIRFFTLEQDECNLMNYISSINDFVIINTDCDIGKPEVLKDPNEYHRFTEDQYLIWLRNDPISLDSFTKRTVLVNARGSGNTILDNKRYFLTALDTPCLEYSRSFVNDQNILTQGRIWVSFTYYYENVLLRKNPELEKGYHKIRNWIVRNFIKLKEVDGYLGQSALEWYRLGKPIYPKPIL